MPHELLYTSAVRGLHMGTDGYCIIAETPGIPRTLAAQLERLSGYRHRVKGKSPDLVNNPVAFSYTIVVASGVRYHVVSRIADAGFDHTHRTNYLAHHIASTTDELPAAGPAWLCLQRHVFQMVWPQDRKPMQLPGNRRLPGGDFIPHKCNVWERLVGDARLGRQTGRNVFFTRSSAYPLRARSAGPRMLVGSACSSPLCTEMASYVQHVFH